VFYLNVEVENLGNTEITELNGQVDIYDKKETEILKSFTFGLLEDPVSPDEIIRTKVNISEFELEPGEYWAIVKIFKDNDVIYENRLYQKVNAAPVPVITAEDVEDIKKPSIPKAADEEVEEEAEESTEESEQLMSVISEEDLATLRAAAGVQQKSNKMFLVFGVIGLVFGLIAMAIIIVLLVIFIKNQRHAQIQRYLTEQQKLSNE
jgi:hypothetical protein